MTRRKMKVTDLPPGSIGAFRSMADAAVAMPRNGSVILATRMEAPWHLVLRRKVQDILVLKPSKRELKKEATL